MTTTSSKITAWLTKQGFTVDNVTKSKRVIQFSGTSGQVEHAFQTSLHSYQVNGETHVSASTDISVPEALAPVIAGVNGLHNFFRKGHMVDVQRLSDQRLSDPRLENLENYLRLGPAYTSSSSASTTSRPLISRPSTTPLLCSLPESTEPARPSPSSGVPTF